MIYKVDSHSGTCDNCGEVFSSFHEGWSLFVCESDVHEHMDGEEWFTGHGDPEHEGKHYCPNCFKHDPDVDDKIILDPSRRKEVAEPATPSPAQPPVNGEEQPKLDFAEIKFAIASIQFNNLSMSADGRAIEANPATHRIAEYVMGLLRQHSTPPASPAKAEQEGPWKSMEQEEPKYGMLRFVRGVILNPEPGITNGETVATINQFWDVSNYRPNTKRWYCEIYDSNKKVTHWMDIPPIQPTAESAPKEAGQVDPVAFDDAMEAEMNKHEWGVIRQTDMETRRYMGKTISGITQQTTMNKLRTKQYQRASEIQRSIPMKENIETVIREIKTALKSLKPNEQEVALKKVLTNCQVEAQAVKGKLIRLGKLSVDTKFIYKGVSYIIFLESKYHHVSATNGYVQVINLETKRHQKLSRKLWVEVKR